jgi:ABC-2 type transport system ATP-binding protein
VIEALPGVTHVETRGEAVIVQCADSDAIARWFLTETSARDLEITSQNLEEAFVALTGDDAPAGAAR